MVAKKKVKSSSEKKNKKFDTPLVSLLEAGSHFGHQVKRWNPRMRPYIWKAKGGVHIFDLVLTAGKIRHVCQAVEELVKEGGEIIFIGTKRQAKEIIKAEAVRAQMPYVNTRWPGGLITNWKQISKSIKTLNKLNEDKKEGKHDKYTKKENVLIERKIQRLERLFGGLSELKGLPAAIFVVDTLREKTAVKEARLNKIPVFAIIDTNSDPDLVDYPIPANDDAVRSIKLIVTKLADAVVEGRARRKK